MTIENKSLMPDYLFEVSWEVCNKVGGIYTVIASKAPGLTKKLKNNYLLIGPDVWKETPVNPDFIEDKFLYKSWREDSEAKGLRFRIGNWNIPGRPVVILVDFTQYFAQKDDILSRLWEKYQVDSYTGQWDYIEPALFGIAASRVIQSFYEFHVIASDHIVAQFHEWMTGSGILSLKGRVPQIATVFTTHATILGRSIAGNGLPLYSNLTEYDNDVQAQKMNIMAKFSLEKNSAKFCDCFTTVSEITARECAHFLKKEVDVLTPNGFDHSLVPENSDFDQKRTTARETLKKVTEGLINQPIDDNAVFLLNSGRYEFHNKGIDLFIDALGKLNREGNLPHTVVACLSIPAYHAGPSRELSQRMEKRDFGQAVSYDYCTHYLHNYDKDAMISRLKANHLNNSPSDKVKVVIIPCYLDGKDGIVNLNYYDFLIGFDLTVFPSYYEPWGYTPLESIAFHVPTITTSLAGFGLWARSQGSGRENAVTVIERDDNNAEFVTGMVAKKIVDFVNSTAKEKDTARQNAYELSKMALWDELLSNYYQAYHNALEKAGNRYEEYKSKSLPVQYEIIPQKQLNPKWNKVLVRPSIIEKLSPLYKLTQNLWWTWNLEAIELFEMINPELWEQCKQNPMTVLESLSLEDYKMLVKDTVFREKLDKVFKKFTDYLAYGPKKAKEQVAYFSMEFGLHHSLKTYSGGLGILAGDYLKEASDSNANIIGVSLLYRYGYFDQSISLLGDQVPSFHPQKYSHLPVIPVRDKKLGADGSSTWVKIQIAAPGRIITAKVWRVDVGRAALYLLDTDIEENTAEDRTITHCLYGDGSELRFKQELLLGIGGIRLLERLKISPDVYHINEGHAAFSVIERLRKCVQEENLTYQEALEVVKASTLFTTHTPVPAGHDRFSEDILRAYLHHYADMLKISWDTFMNLGKAREFDPTEEFSMSYLAATLSSETNGVSRIHGSVTRDMFAELYPGYFPEELHISHVTNGVHFPTWVSKRWKKLYDSVFDPEYINDLSNHEYWKKIYGVPDETIWKIRQEQRSELINFLRSRLINEMTLRQDNPQNIFNVSQSLNPKALTIGFARRFATYKRANMLFSNLDRLSKIVNNPEYPVQFVYAGKAHPKDVEGQKLIKKIYEISMMTEFLGKIVIVENYDIELGKKLVQGVDIWLNTPTRPQEASGTSGEKAVMNGVINFSVLDGWWAEGYRPEAGWALKEERTYKNQAAQDALDAATIYNMLENEIAPMFYKRTKKDIPLEWVQKIKHTIALIVPEYTTKRMLDDYRDKYYRNICKRSIDINSDNYLNAKKLAAWKQKVFRAWDSIEIVSVTIPDSNKKPLSLGEKFYAEIKIKLHELNKNDVGVEMVFGQKSDDVVNRILFQRELKIKNTNHNVITYSIEFPSVRIGVFDYAFRIFPKNPLLANRQDFSLMKWI